MISKYLQIRKYIKIMTIAVLAFRIVEYLSKPKVEINKIFPEENILTLEDEFNRNYGFLDIFCPVHDYVCTPFEK